MATLHIDSLHFAYLNNKVLQGVYLKCQTGKRMALCGVNGSGKSTLLKIIAGQLLPSSGVIKFEGQLIPRAKRFDYLAWLPQESFLPKSLKVRQAIKLFSQKNQEVQLLSDERIKLLANNRIRNLSGGEKRYIETLMVLSLKRDFYLLDEPFTEIEPLYRLKLYEIIENLSQDAGFIMVDHNIDAMARIASGQLILSEGEVFPIKEAIHTEV